MIVHVRDASHPELAFQAREVERVLAEDLKATPEQLSSVIQVFNKVDLVPKPERSFSEARALTTCAKSGEGVHELLQVVEARIVELSGEVVRKIRIPMVDTERLSWLHTVSDALHCKCSHPSQARVRSISCQKNLHFCDCAPQCPLLAERSGAGRGGQRRRALPGGDSPDQTVHTSALRRNDRTCKIVVCIPQAVIILKL